MAEYKLSYTAQEIDSKLGKISEIENSLYNKQDKLTFDLEPVEDGENPITSGGVYMAIQNAKPNYDEAPTENSTNLVNSGSVYTAIQNAKPNLEYDEVPTEDSTNLVTSGSVHKSLEGVYESLQGKQDALMFDEIPTEGSENLVTSGAIYAALANNSTDDEEIMDLMAEMELIDPVTLSDGSILVSNNNEIYTI